MMKNIHPEHYSKHSLEIDGVVYEPIDILCFLDPDWARHTALKYLIRYKDKGNPEEDLRKALYYLNYRPKKVTEEVVRAFCEKSFSVKLFLENKDVSVIRNYVKTLLETL